MNPFKAKIIGIATIALVSWLQVAFLLFALSCLNPLISIRLIFLIDLAFPVVLLFSIWQGQTIGNLITIPQLFQLHKNRFIASTTVILETTTILGLITCILLLIIINHFNGIHIIYWFNTENFILIVLFFMVGLHQHFSKRFGAPLTYYILKKFRK